MSSPSITFVVPAYNVQDTLADTLESLLAQTRGDWAGVVVDDGSGDSTRQIAEGFAARSPRLHVILQANRGLAGARNAGVALVRTPMVCFLDADDTLAPGFVERMTGAIGDADAVACATRMVGPSLEDLDWTLRPGPDELTPGRLLEYNPIPVGSVVVRVDAVRQRMGVDEPWFDENLAVHEDWDLWVRLTGRGLVWGEPVSEALFSYRLREGSLTSRLGTMWVQGLGVIDRHARSPGLRAALARQWTVRHLARAIAADDAKLVDSLKAELGALHAGDLGVLGPALVWAFCQAHRVGPAHVGERGDRWREQVRRHLRAQPHLDTLLGGLRWGDDWKGVAARVRRLLDEGRPVAVYGLGRNGRTLIAELDALGPASLDVLDDRGEARPPATQSLRLRRIASDDLTRDHAVVVTPSHARRLVEALDRRSVRDVIVPGDGRAAA